MTTPASPVAPLVHTVGSLDELRALPVPIDAPNLGAWVRWPQGSVVAIWEWSSTAPDDDAPEWGTIRPNAVQPSDPGRWRFADWSLT